MVYNSYIILMLDICFAAQSPVFSHVSDTLVGLQSIRALGMSRKFQQDFDRFQNKHSSAFFLFLAANRWFSLRSLFCLDVYFILVILLSLALRDGKMESACCTNKPFPLLVFYALWTLIAIFCGTNQFFTFFFNDNYVIMLLMSRRGKIVVLANISSKTKVVAMKSVRMAIDSSNIYLIQFLMITIIHKRTNWIK